MFDSSIAALMLAGAFLFSTGETGVDGPSLTQDPPAPADDIVEVAASAGSFGTLVAAIEAAGLVEVLKGDGPFTVFTPTDAAFAEIPKEDLNALLAEKEKLAAVLTYHVGPGRVTSDQVVNLTSAETVDGESIQIRVVDGKVLVDGATVVRTDIEAENGVIHVIDKVILPGY